MQWLYEYVIYLKGLSHEMDLAFDDTHGEYIKIASMSLETFYACLRDYCTMPAMAARQKRIFWVNLCLSMLA